MLKLSDNLDLPLDFITERIAFLARTGAGKSGGMRVLFEQIFDAGQFAIFIDPKGDAYGIRGAGIGKGKAVLVMGGDHGDVPLEAAAGKVIAEFLVHERVSTVLDVSDFGKADMIRFVADLCRTLYQRNRDVVHIFIDEADMVAGEKFYDPRCLEAIQLIQNKGRHRGFGVTVATQRSAMINKTVLFASGTLIAMQTTSPKDIAVIREWLEVVSSKEISKEIVAELPLLKTREAIVYSPQLLPEPVRITFNEFQTFDSMRTPKPGEARQQPKSLADIDLSAVQRDMAATIEKVKAEDPRTLKAEVAKLRRELDLAQKETSKAVTETVEVAVVPQEFRNEITALGSQLTDVSQLLNKIDDLHLDSRVRLNKLLENVKNYAAQPKAAAAAAGARSSASIERPKHGTPQKPLGIVTKKVPDDFCGQPLTKAESMILRGLFWTKDDRDKSPAKIGFYAGYRAGTGSFNNALSGLRSKGLLLGWTITPAGEAQAAIDAEAKPTGSELREWLRPKLGKCENEVLDALVSFYPDRATLDQIAERTPSQYKVGTGSFNNALARLRSLEAAEGGSKEGVKAADVFFE